MGPRSPLPGAVAVLILFWWGVATLAFFLMPPAGMDAWLDHLGVSHPDITPVNQLGVFFQLLIQAVKTAGTGGIWGAAIAFVAGLGVLAWHQRRHQHRAKAEPTWRSMSTSIGRLQKMSVPAALASVNLPKSVKFSPTQQRLLHCVLGYLKSCPDAFVGDGHKGTLLDHTLNVMAEAVARGHTDPMVILLAACHDIGKTVAWKKKEGEWQRVGWHAQEGAKLLAKFDAWWALPVEERIQLRYALAYEHSPQRLPSRISKLSLEGYERLRELIDLLREIDGMATSAEKQETLAAVDIEAAVLDAFMSALPTMPFHEAKKPLPKGVNGVGWRQGSRLFLIEKEARDRAMAELEPDVFAALGGTYRVQGEVATFSQELFKALANNGWLVTEAEGGAMPGDANGATLKVSPDYPFFNIKSGTVVINGVFIVEMAENMRHGYPDGETPFPISIQSIQWKKKAAKEGKKQEKTAEHEPSAPTNEAVADDHTVQDVTPDSHEGNGLSIKKKGEGKRRGKEEQLTLLNDSTGAESDTGNAPEETPEETAQAPESLVEPLPETASDEPTPADDTVLDEADDADIKAPAPALASDKTQVEDAPAAHQPASADTEEGDPSEDSYKNMQRKLRIEALAAQVINTAANAHKNDIDAADEEDDGAIKRSPSGRSPRRRPKKG